MADGCPIAIPEIDFTQVAELGDALLGKLNALREAAPVAWNDSIQAWAVTGFEEVNAGFAGKLPLSDVRLHAAFRHFPEEVQEREFPRMLRALPTWVLNSDPPYHTRLRILMVNAFSKKVVERIRPFAQATIAEVLDRVAGKSEVEFIDEIARAITGRTIMHYLGIPERAWVDLERWSYAINVALGTGQATLTQMHDAERALEEMQGMFEEEIVSRERERQEDFLSELVHARDGKDRLTREELYGVLLVSLIAGHDTTMNTMGLSVVALHRQPDKLAELLDGRGDMSGKLMELMRYVAMSSMQIRMASDDFEWSGQQIRAGDTVALMIAGANRDPRVFGCPETIDFANHPADKVLSFGGGRHYCIGHYLAKMQLEEFLTAFFRRFDIEILDDPLVWWPVLSQRGLEHLNLQLTEKSVAKAA